MRLSPASLAALITLPWLILYVSGIWLYYNEDPSRWNPKGLVYTHFPYISGLLGDGRDSTVLRTWRCIWWCVGVLPTVCARLVVWRAADKFSMAARWMVFYSVAWILCVASAEWDKFEDTNPLPQLAHGDILHFVLSLVFFITAGAETYVLNLTNLFPRNKIKALILEILYITGYCSTFVLSKKVKSLVWLKYHLLPLLEHFMLWMHVTIVTTWTYKLAKRTALEERQGDASHSQLLLQASGAV